MSDFNDYSPRPHKGDRLYWPLNASPIRPQDYYWWPHKMELPRCRHERLASVLTDQGRWECAHECQENLAPPS